MINLQWNEITEIYEELKKKKITKNSNIIFSIQIFNQQEPLLLKHKFHEFQKIMWGMLDSEHTVKELMIVKDGNILYHFEHKQETLEIVAKATNKIVLNWNKLKPDERKAHINITLSEISNA